MVSHATRKALKGELEVACGGEGQIAVSLFDTDGGKGSIMPNSSGRLAGVIMVIASAILWSTAGLFVRMADLDTWSIVFWRSGFSFATLGLFILIRNRVEHLPGNRSFGLPGIAGAAVSVVASITYIASLKWTSVANVMTVYAMLPFAATGIAFLWFGERITSRFIVAGLFAFAGVFVSVNAAVSPGDIAGIVAASVMTVGCAIQLAIARRYATLDTTQMTVWSGVACWIIAIPFAQLAFPAPMQLLACALYGILTTGVAYVLLLLGSRRIGSGEAGLLSMLDVVLGPVWVWLFYSEYVSLPVLVGGGIVLISVVWYLAGSRRISAAVA